MWAQAYNAGEGKHFPVVAISYAYLSMIKTTVREERTVLKLLPNQLVNNNFIMQLNIKPEETFLYDDMTTDEVFTMF
jgi:acid stress-induced BolA-like protein IbaG/YrbA